MVTINESNYAMGRYPNANAVNKGFLNFEGHGSNFITDDQFNSNTNWKGAELAVRTSRWTIERSPITSSENTRINYGTPFAYDLPDGYGYFIQNDIRTLDRFGEWYYNPSVKKLYVFFGNKSTSSYSVQVAAINTLIEANANDIVINSLTLKGANEYGVFCEWANMRNLQVKNCQILFSGIDAIQLSGRSKFTLENSLINHSNTTAVNLNYNDPHPVIKNNTISNTGIFPGMISRGQTSAIYSVSKGLIAENNKILNSGYVGIRFGGDSNFIKNNYIDKFCTVLDDGAGVYSWTGGQNTTYYKRTIIGNIILNGVGAPEGSNQPEYSLAEGIYLDDNVTNVEISCNTVAHCKNNGLKIHNARNIQVQNNTFFNNESQLITEHDHYGNAVSNLLVTDNIFFSKKAHQITAHFRSIKDDFLTIGSFSGNYYARPLDDNLTLMSEYLKPSSNVIKQYFDIKSAKLAYGKNNESGGSPMQVKPYTLISVNESNKYKNPGFETSASGVYCWSPKSDCYTSWTTTSALDKRAVKISGSSFGLVALNCGAIDRTKQYILRFLAIAERESVIEVYLRQSNSPWGNISATKSLRITPQKNEYEVLFSFPNSEEASSVVFQASSGNFSYWLDNVRLYEAKVATTNPDDFIRFEYNPTLVNKTITLEAPYLDVKNNSYSGSVVLKPFASLVLIKKTTSQLSPTGALDVFNTRLEGCQVRLNWMAYLTNEFSHFELEKSEDGNTFTTISEVTGKINAGLQTYDYLDTKVNATNFYRLKMVGKDGNFSYSPVREQISDCDAGPWQLYPTLLNGANSELTVKLFTKNASINFTIIDQFGRKIKTFQEETIEGWNRITWNLAGLSPGMYYLQQSDITLKPVLPFVMSTN